MNILEFDDKNLPTDWELEKLFGYSDYTDSKIERDIKKGIKEIKAFAKKWSGRDDWLNDTKVLAEVLKEYFTPTSENKALFYLYSYSTKDTNNSALQAVLARLSDQVSKAAETNLFFELKLGKVDKKTQQKFLSATILQDYKFWLTELFRHAKHDLTEAEERIISRYSRPKGSLWLETLQKSLNKKTIVHKGKELSQAEAAAQVSLETNTKLRRQLNDKLYNLYAELEDTAEGTMNAILLNRKIANELRGYKKPYSATVLAYQNTEKEVEELVRMVKENYKVVSDYYKLKQAVLGLDDFTYADRNIEVGKVAKKYSYQDSVKVVHSVLAKFSKEATEAFEKMVTDGQYDAFPQVGKRGGAYQNSTSDQPILVFLNHVGGFNDMMTLAHETGHALHTYFTYKNQPYQYQDYPISTAEVASTFVENLVFYDKLPTLSEKEQFVALMSKMNNMVNTIQRQIAFFETERRLHEEILANGHISTDKMKQILLEELRSYLGKSVQVPDATGSLVYVMAQAHFSNPFYVYAYAYGELIAQAMHRLYMENKTKGTNAAINFMSAGSSARPKDIFKRSGVKVNTELWQSGLEVMKSDLKKLKRLHKKLHN